jgi:6,7-dimethyl-8-ribityllumazine synthase
VGSILMALKGRMNGAWWNPVFTLTVSAAVVHRQMIWQLALCQLYSVRLNHHAQILRSEDSQPATGRQVLSAKGLRFAIVASRWNDSIVSRLIAGAREALAELSADENGCEIFRVPGSFEIPLCALKAAQSGRFDAVICLGVIVRGETPHFDYIAAETARGLGEASLKTGVPLLFGVITADNIAQANDRAGEKLNNKGFEAARAAVELAILYREDFGAEPPAVAHG